MSSVLFLELFVLGAAVGSFLNVLASRYSEKAGFKKAFRGRSRCDHCKRTLHWYELIPILSFVFLRGRCKSCGRNIPALYTLIEILAGLILVLVPLKIGITPFAIIWVLALWTLLLISLIDLRLRVIPNTLVILIGLLGLASFVYRYNFGLVGGLVPLAGSNLLGHYSMVLIFSLSPWVNYVGAVIAGIILFGGIYLLTRGKAMGFGDVKLIAALGFLIAWPDIIVVLILPFLLGSAVGLPMMLLKKVRFKSSIPFGPFIALGVTLTFFFGYDIVNAYFKLFNLV